MSRVCQVTGKKALVGHNVSHSNLKTKRRFEVNLRSKRFWLEDEKRWISLRLSARAMRTIRSFCSGVERATMCRPGSSRASCSSSQAARSAPVSICSQPMPADRAIAAAVAG